VLRQRTRGDNDYTDIAQQMTRLLWWEHTTTLMGCARD